MLLMSAVLPTAILTVPMVTVKFAKQDAWLSLLAATLVAVGIALLTVNLSLRFPEKTLFVYPEEIVGKVAGKIVSGLYVLYYLHLGSAVVREFVFFLAAAIMPKTPIIIFSIILIIVASYAVRNGLEVLSRFNQLFIPVTGLLVIAFLLSTKDMKPTRLLPVFDTGLTQVLKGSIFPAMWMGEIVTIAVIIPYLNKPKQAYHVAVIATLLNSFFLTASFLEVLLIFGPHLTGDWLYPTFNVMRVISYTHILERFESIVLVLWLLGGFVKIGVYYYAAVLGSAQWLGLRDYKPLVAPVGVILVALASLLYGGNIVDLEHFFAYAWIPFDLAVFEAGIPLALLCVALVRGKGGKKG